MSYGKSVAQWLASVYHEICRALLSRARAPPPASWPDGGPESLRSPCCGQKPKPQCLTGLKAVSAHLYICIPIALFYRIEQQ
ncbi:hypothetical protein PoB_005931900 [Plakobranchus ocellatus]|uniref:Uncharacterized protein n=1 Tax=Plakobranchus ocellatus TaxID=259542 RepID=A0AAV4CMV6_9GAST|nr:hypothetical protein PoB_005931900 [Plakobranchus ocellatus]